MLLLNIDEFWIESLITDNSDYLRIDLGSKTSVAAIIPARNEQEILKDTDRKKKDNDLEKVVVIFY